MVRIVDNITKEYPNMFKINVYKNQLVVPLYTRTPKRHESLVGKDYKPEVSSMYRTKTLVKDIIYCNDFDMFATFTFDPDKVDSFNFYHCLHCVTTFLAHQKEKSPDLQYLIVPEPHKSGRWHFHALLKHFKGTLRDSKHFSSTGRRVYNITSYRSGFSTAVYIDDKEAVAEYVSKYITKDFIRIFNKRRFYCSKGLLRPIKTINSPVLRQALPLAKRMIYDYEDVQAFIVDKSF